MSEVPNSKRQGELAAHARRMLHARREIGKHFDGALFADAARDILLDLFVAAEERRTVSVSSCCIAAAVPYTTALRWITVLRDRGLLIEEADTKDARRRLVRLSDRARDAMANYIEAILVPMRAS